MKKIIIFCLFILLCLSVFVGCGQESEGNAADASPVAETAKPREIKKKTKTSKKKVAQKKKRKSSVSKAKEKLKYVYAQITFEYEETYSLKSFINEVIGQDERDEDGVIQLYLDGEKMNQVSPGFSCLFYGKMMEGYHVLQAVRRNGETAGIKFYIRKLFETNEEDIFPLEMGFDIVYWYDKLGQTWTMDENDSSELEIDDEIIEIGTWKKTME